MKVVGRNFENRKIEYVPANGATTSGAMAKWMVSLDSACLIPLESTSHDFFDCSGGLKTAGEEEPAEF